MTARVRWFSWRGKPQDAVTEERYFTVDLITSLVVSIRDEFRREEIVERVIELKKSVPFEMRHLGRVVSTDDEIRTSVEDLLDEGVANGWIEAVTMRCADDCRQDIPLRLREELKESPSLRGTLGMILAKAGLPPLSELSQIPPNPLSTPNTSEKVA